MLGGLLTVTLKLRGARTMVCRVHVKRSGGWDNARPGGRERTGDAF